MSLKKTALLVAAAGLMFPNIPVPIRGSKRVKAKSPLTPKQAKKRAKNKRAKKSRKKNR